MQTVCSQESSRQEAGGGGQEDRGRQAGRQGSDKEASDSFSTLPLQGAPGWPTGLAPAAGQLPGARGVPADLLAPAP